MMFRVTILLLALALSGCATFYQSPLRQARVICMTRGGVYKAAIIERPHVPTYADVYCNDGSGFVAGIYHP